MTKTRAQVEAEFDALIDELGDAQPVITDGPATNDDTSDQDYYQLTGKAVPVALVSDLVRTRRQAIEWGRDQAQSNVAVFRGLCLMFVRMCFNVDALYPDAATAWQESADRHHTADPADVPRGHAVCWAGGNYGHIALALGNGRCLSNDTGAPGTINVANIADISAAWGYQLVGWLDEVNGETAPAPRPRRRVSTRDWRIRHLRLALVAARRQGQHVRAARLRRWLGAIS